MDTSDIDYEDLVKNIGKIDCEGKIKLYLQYLTSNINFLQQIKTSLIITFNNISNIPNAYDNIDEMLGKISSAAKNINKTVTNIDAEIARQVYLESFPELDISNKEEL